MTISIGLWIIYCDLAVFVVQLLAMENKELCSSPSSNLLSPKLRIKAQKRRRTLLGDGETKLDRSTKELLTALREPTTGTSQQNQLRPLPAISSPSRKPGFDCPLASDANNLPRCMSPALGLQSKDRRRQRSDAAGLLERFPTFTKEDRTAKHARPSKAVHAEEDRNCLHREPSHASEKGNRFKCGFSDASDDLGFQKETRRRSNRRRIDSNDDESTFVTPNGVDARENGSGSSTAQIDAATPRRRIIRRNRNSPAEVTPIENLTLIDSEVSKTSSKRLFDCNTDFEKSKRGDEFPERRNLDVSTPTLLSINHPVLAKPGKLRPLANGADLTQDDFSATGCEPFIDEKRPARRPRLRGKLRENDESGARGLNDCAFSDAASVFSDDLTDAYDPTFFGHDTATSSNRKNNLRNGNLHFDKARDKATSADANSERDDVLTIFTSPKRHKKRSRRRPLETENQTRLDAVCATNADNGIDALPINLNTNLFGNDKTTTLFCSEDRLPGAGVKAGRRKTHNKYLPPLAEALDNLK